MNSWAELGKAALDVLGKSAPWVVIACLAAFGIYKMQELNQNNLVSVQGIAEKERTQAREDFSVANKALKDTYEAANKLYTEMMTSVGTSLKQLQTLESEVREKQKAAFQSQIDAEGTRLKLQLQQAELTEMQKQVTQVRADLEAQRATAESARKEATEALAAKTVAEVSIRDLTSRLAREKDDLEKTSHQLDDTKRQVDEKREELQQAIIRLKDVSVLASELASLPDNPTRDAVVNLRHKARAVLPGLDEFLTSYRDKPASRDELDTSSLVGIKISELKQSIQTMEGFHWFVVYDPYLRRGDKKLSIRIVALPGDQKGKPFIRSSIVFKLSDLSEDKVDAFRGDPSIVLDEALAVSGIEVSGSIIFRCLNPKNFGSAQTMRLSSGNRSVSTEEHQIGAEVSLREAIGSTYQFVGRAHQLRGDTWPQKVHSPDDVLKLVPELVRGESRPDFELNLCLSFMQNRDLLARADIKIVGLTEAERNLIQRDLTQSYRRIFHPTQNFVDLPNPPIRDQDTGAFISGIARVALINRTVTVKATKTEAKITLEIDYPQGASDALKRLDPLYVELVDDKMQIVPGLVASKSP
jgi:hypothetical protein